MGVIWGAVIFITTFFRKLSNKYTFLMKNISVVCRLVSELFLAIELVVFMCLIIRQCRTHHSIKCCCFISGVITQENKYFLGDFWVSHFTGHLHIGMCVSVIKMILVHIQEKFHVMRPWFTTLLSGYWISGRGYFHVLLTDL